MSESRREKRAKIVRADVRSTDAPMPKIGDIFEVIAYADAPDKKHRTVAMVINTTMLSTDKGNRWTATLLGQRKSYVFSSSSFELPHREVGPDTVRPFGCQWTEEGECWVIPGAKLEKSESGLSYKYPLDYSVGNDLYYGRKPKDETPPVKPAPKS